MPYTLSNTNRSLFERLQHTFKRMASNRRLPLTFYLKFILFILILYYINFLIGFKYYMWIEKSFEDEYPLTMTHIDAVKLEDKPQDILGPEINILSIRYLIENEYLCGRSLDPEIILHPHVLIIVKSLSENFKERQAIRSTWGEKNRLNAMGIRLGFVLGTNSHNISVEDESKKYEDIIQIDKIDHYYYSSYKLVMALRWITDHCTTHTRRTLHTDLRNYVLFVDDDYYVDVESLLSYVNTIDHDSEMTTYERRIFITGQLITNSRPQRFINDHWYVSVADYPYDQYPPYLSSECVLMTRYNARLYYLASKYLRLFHFDYVYMGLIAYSMSVNLIENNHLFLTSLIQKSNNYFEYFSAWKTFSHNEKTRNSTVQPICTHGYRGEKLINFWNKYYQKSHI